MKKGTVYYALDISSDKIAAIKAVVNRAGDIIDVQCRAGKSAGVKNGRISELGQLSQSISEVVDKLSVLSGSKIKSLYVSLQCPRINARHSICAIPLSERSNKIITSGDIAKVNQQAYSLSLTIEEQLLHQIPQEYTIDNHHRVLDPAGLYGHKLGADILLITTQAKDAQNLVSAVEQAGYKARAVILSIFAASLTVLPQELKKKGCFLLDVGFDCSQLIVFKDGILRGYESFDFGAHHITEALAAELKLSYGLAEDTKVSYGAALSANIADQQEVLVKKEQSYRPIKRRAICAIIEQKLRGFSGLLKERLESYQKTGDEPLSMVVSGKEALLEGFIENLELNTGIVTHLAKIEGAPISDITYAAAVGLAKYAASEHLPFHLFAVSSYGTLFEKIVRKTREIYHEYF